MKRVLRSLYQIWQDRWCFSAVLKTAFTCGHHDTPVHEGKCYCPTCGEGVVYRWLLMRCTACHGKRESRYFLRQWLPKEAFCTACGEQTVYHSFIESPKYHQLHKASLVLLNADQFEQSIPFKKHWKIILEPKNNQTRPKAMLASC